MTRYLLRTLWGQPPPAVHRAKLGSSPLAALCWPYSWLSLARAQAESAPLPKPTAFGAAIVESSGGKQPPRPAACCRNQSSCR